MYASFGTQKAIRVITFDLDTGGLDARDIAFRFFQNLGLETLTLAVAQVLAQQHGRPVLGLGAARTRLNINETIVLIEWVGEHAPELQRLDL